MRYSILLLTLLIGCASTPEKILSAPQYQHAISTHVERRLNAPKDFHPEYDCTFHLEQNHTGIIKVARVGDCDASDQLLAIFKKTIAASSPLPLPDNAALFDSKLVFRFCRECERQE